MLANARREAAYFRGRAGGPRPAAAWPRCRVPVRKLSSTARQTRPPVVIRTARARCSATVRRLYTLATNSREPRLVASTCAAREHWVAGAGAHRTGHGCIARGTAVDCACDCRMGARGLCRAAGAAAAARPVVHASARHRRSSAGTHTPARAAAPRYFRPPTRCMRSEASPGAQDCSADGACGCAGCDCRTAPAEPTYCAVPVLYRTRWQ